MAKKRIPSSILAASLSLALCFAAGCGSGGGDGASAHPSAPATGSSYKGTYRGAWNTSDRYGSLDITVSATGKVSGWMLDRTLGLKPTGYVSDGTVYEDGWIELSYEYPAWSNWSNAKGTMSGTAKKVGNSLLVTGEDKAGGNTIALKSNLVKVDAPVNLAGKWRVIDNGEPTDEHLLLSQAGNTLSGERIYTSGNAPNIPLVGTLKGSNVVMKNSDSYTYFEGVVSTGFSCDDFDDFDSTLPPAGTTPSTSAGCMFAFEIDNHSSYSPVFQRKKLQRVP